jgi:hypothetical protein
MGVKDLKYLIQKYSPISNKNFDVGIIDGTNLFIIILSRIKKKLITDNKLSLWEGISLNVVQQYKFIVENSVAEIDLYLNTIQKMYNLKKILIVTDPTNLTEYNINNCK